MKGLLLAGGHGTRLRPLTFSGNKHMLPIANQPMLFYGLRHLADAGIREVGVILGPIREGIEETVGDGHAFGLRITYIEQGPPKGLAHAVLCARPFLGADPFVMYLGDNLLQQGALPLVRRFSVGDVDAVLGVTPVPHPSRYGVVEMDGDRIVSIVEKPAAPRSDLALTGVYAFSKAIHPIIERLEPSARGELEITDAIWQLHRNGGQIAVERVGGWWKDTGRPEDLLEANENVLRTRPAEAFTIEGLVEPGAELTGPVALGAGSRVEGDCRVIGPTVIGAGVRIETGSQVGPYSAIGDRCVIRRATVERCILLEEVEIEGSFQVADSIIGRGARLRSDRAEPCRLTCVLGDATQIRL
jgi:glucose-1-phosphate thymidylyltransferase